MNRILTLSNGFRKHINFNCEQVIQETPRKHIDLHECLNDLICISMFTKPTSTAIVNCMNAAKCGQMPNCDISGLVAMATKKKM